MAIHQDRNLHGWACVRHSAQLRWTTHLPGQLRCRRSVCVSTTHDCTGSTLIMAALTFYRMHEAYSAFMALGPGLALPSSGAGFWRAVHIAQRRPNANGTGFLQQLSQRQGPTPYTLGATLHEQISHQPPEDVQQYFADRLALFAATQFNVSNATSSTSGTTARRSSSVHVILHPSDFEAVISTGHGEIHPLAHTDCSFSRFRGNSCLPGTLALIYAPREYSEVCTVMRIIEAGAKYVASIDGEAM